MPRATLLCCLAAACGGGTDANKDGIVDGVYSPDSVSQIAPSTPIGTLSGQVLKTDFAGLDGVKVTVIIGGIASADGTAYTATTDNDGIWAVKGLPAAANAQVVFTKENYVSLRLQATVPGAAGNFPVNNGNGNVGTVLLPQLQGKVTFQLVTSNGAPAGMVKAQLEVSPAAIRYAEFGGYGNPVGVFVAEATSDANGVLSFTNAPQLSELSRLNGTYTVTVGAVDENMDGRFELLGARKDFQARDLFLGSVSTIITLPLNRSPGPLTVLASNIDSMVNGPGDPLRSMVKPTESLFFTFDQALLASSVTVKVTDELGLTTLMSTKTAKAPNILEVQVQGLESGKEYNIALRATSAESGATFQQAAYFFGGDPTMPKMFGVEKITWRRPAGGAATTRLDVGDTVVITFNQPIRQLAAALEVQIDFDINNLNGKGDVAGELSPPGAMNPQTAGFPVAAREPLNEPMSTFSNMPSGYTTRYEFVYGAPGTVTVPANTQFRMMFGKIPSSLTGFRTLWGTAVEADIQAALSMP